VIWSVIAAALVFVVIVWQERFRPSNDGRRYTGEWWAPTPFHRRFHRWTPTSLRAATAASFVLLGAALGDWRQTTAVLTCSGALFCASYLTVDAVAIALAWTAATLFQQPEPELKAIAFLLSFMSGIVHEKGPVFAAVYAWNPWLLFGIAGVQWWAKPDPQDADPYVGHPSTWSALQFHRKAQDLLDPMAVVVPLRGLLVAPVVFGAEPRTWAALSLAYVSRVMGTDPGRFMWWAAPPLAFELGQRGGHWVPLILALHLATMKRFP
jgi:hypothetical protein